MFLTLKSNVAAGSQCPVKIELLKGAGILLHSEDFSVDFLVKLELDPKVDNCRGYRSL